MRKWIKSHLEEDERPYIKLLDSFSTSIEALWFEQYWISQFRTWGFDLLNIADGGNEGYITNPNRDKSGYLYKTKRVYQYSQNGDFITEYPSGKVASKATGISNTQISTAINDKQNTRTCGGFLWRNFYSPQIEVIKPKWGNTGNSHSEETKRIIRERGKSYRPTKEALAKQAKAQMKPILQYDRDRNLIREWGSAKEVKEELGFKIYSDRHGFKCSQHNYHWMFKE